MKKGTRNLVAALAVTACALGLLFLPGKRAQYRVAAPAQDVFQPSRPVTASDERTEHSPPAPPEGETKASTGPSNPEPPEPVPAATEKARSNVAEPVRVATEESAPRISAPVIPPENRGTALSFDGPVYLSPPAEDAAGSPRRRAKKRRISRDVATPETKQVTEDLRQVAVTDPVEVFDGFENRRAPLAEVLGKPMTATAVDPLSTFAIDVDTGSYTLARSRLREGYLPRPDDVRVEEFLNYFHYDYPQPQNGAFSAHIESAPDPFGEPDLHLLRIGIQGRDVGAAERPPAHLTFLIDVSGSMFGNDKLELAREALELVTRNLRSDDTIALVTYARGANVELWPVGASSTDLALAAIARLEAGGASALDEGLARAYEVASTHFYAGHINRVVVMSDGRANVGSTSPEEILRRVRHGVEDGVALTTIGFGAKSFNDAMMERLADDGDGNYFFVDSYREAERVFRDRLCGTLHVIARDAKIQVEFDPTNVRRFRLVGYENRKLKHEEFRDDSVDAGEIGAGHSVTALYQIELEDRPQGMIAAIRVRHEEPGEGVSREVEFEYQAEELVDDVREASSDFRFQAAVALFASSLRERETLTPDRLSFIEEIAGEGITRREDQVDRVEFVEMVRAAQFYAN